jgi:hypothetical protein
MENTVKATVFWLATRAAHVAVVQISRSLGLQLTPFSLKLPALVK